MAATSGRVPIRLEAPVTATSPVRSDSSAPTVAGSSSPVAGSKSAQRTVAPRACAACTQGRMFASWSSRVTTTSSPGPQPADSTRDSSYVRAVALRPKTTPPGSPPVRSAIACRAATTTASARRSAAVTEPRLAIGAVIVAATAWATASGVCDPPGPSKWAAPPARAGNWARSAATSKLTRPR